MQLNDPSATRPAVTPHAVQGAAHWLATLSDESCSDVERQQFFEWLRSSTHHVDEFLRLSTLARSTGKRELWPEQSIESLLADARASINVTALDIEKPASPLPRTRSSVIAWASAASVACVLAVAALVLTNTRMLEPLTGGYSTRIGEQRSITLEDGSVVELNSQSLLRTHFAEHLRAVELVEGEAIFRVTKDPERPFRVRTGATDIVAIGTAFNVNANETRTIITVLEGRVRVNNRGDAAAGSAAQPGEQVDFVELAVGEQVIVAPARPIIRLALEDTRKVTSWTERRLIFEDTSLEAAAAEFARYSPRAIRFADAQIGARKISGVFDATDPASLMEFLSSDETLEVRTSGDGWVVRNRNPSL